MANSISGVTMVNPYGAKDTCANIKTEEKSTLIISECMPYISEYTFQFWIKSKGNKTVIFNCDSNVRKIYTTPDWLYFTITFKVNSISNITLLFPKGEFWIYNTKLEIGQYDTDWSPHPEDVQADVKNLESKIQDLDDKLLLKQTETISTAIDLINKQELYTERSLTRTQFVSEIYGILSGINANLDDIQEGNGKWHVSIYDKNDFLKLTKMPSGETDWDTNLYSLPTDIDDTDTVYDDGSVWNSSETEIVLEDENEPDDDIDDESEEEQGGESPHESPLDNDDEDIDDRDRIDMKIFSMENSDILPLEELLIEDEPQKLRIEGKGKIIYYYTFAKFTEDFLGLINCPFKDASLYINGVQIISQAVIGTRKAMVQFLKGWNLIEIISNEGNFTIDPSISSLEQCEVINCLVAVPTNRNVKVSTKSSGIYTTIDLILSEVWEYALEQYTDENGNVHSRKVLEGSRIKQTKDMISLLVKSASGDYSDLQVTPKFIDAITKKFTITDPTTGKRVIIAGGKIISESIDTDMLNTDVITSKNFDGGYKAPVRIRNTETGVEREFNKMNLDDLFDENGEIVFNEHGTYLDLASGNFISPSMIILNEYSYTPEGESIPITIQNKAYFKGDVYAENGYFNGTVNSNTGYIGPWVIDSSAIYKGEYAQGQSKLGVHGEEYAYFGDDGLSLSDLFIYDSKNLTLRLRVNTLDISGQDILDFTTTAVDGNNTYYVQLLTDINALVQSWNNELSKHLDETCYVISTGKLYRFVKKSTLSANDKIAQILYNITFNDSTELRAGDYISIYYKYGKSIYKVVLNPLVPSSGNYSLSSLAGATITIPSDDFYVFLHVGEESSGLVDYYGFTIDDMSSEYGEIEDVTFGIRANLPNYPMDRTLAVNEFPETDHPYVLALTNKLWQVRTSLANNSDDYEWVEIVNQEYAEGARNALRALTYMHYDATNGLILHNGLQPLPIDGTVPTQETLNGLEGGNVRITSNGMDVYIGNYLITRYGPSSVFYYYDSTNNTTEERLVLNSEGVKIKNGTFMLGEYQRDLGNGSTTTDYKFKVFDDGNFLLGTSNGEHIQYDNGHLDLNVSSLSVGASDITDIINDTTQNTQELAKKYIKDNFEDYIDEIQSNDYKITFWYSATAPDQEYEWEENLVSDLHTYDIWHNTSNDTYQMYKLISDPPVLYMGWESIPEPPNCLKDIDHSMNIYFADSITQITGLEVNDLWYRGEEASLLIYVFRDGTHQWVEYDKYASNLAQIESFKEQYQNELRALSNQLDGKAQTYEQPNDPSASWSTLELKKQHVGDLWHDAEYDSYGAQIGNDLYYKYQYNVDTASYSWVLLSEQPPSLIRQAIYNKADMFTTEVNELPNPPYKVNDLWLNATYSEMGLTIYKNEILRCIHTKTSSQTPSINDWALSNDYSTDLDSFKNSYRNNMIAIAHQVDGYADTWTSTSDPASNWYNQSTGVDTREEHIGDIWKVGDEDSNTFRVYVKNANTNEYQWVTEDIPYLFKEAVKNNVRIFSTVDNVCPTPPYKKNDLWIGATFTYNGTSYVNELMKCVNSKNRGQSGSFADWEVASEVSRKARTFIVGMPNTLPTPPYSVGDLWLNATYNGTVNGVDYHYSHEILQCVTSKGSEGTASITDWAVSNNYTDDSALTNFLLRYDKNLSIISSQIDRSSETYESATDPYSTWAEGSEDLHVGDIWHNTSNNTYKIFSMMEDNGMYVYSWEDLGDDIPQLVQNAIKQNSKIFSTVGQASGTLPQPPYKVNDIWCGASFTGNGTTGTNGKIYTNEIMRCKVTRHKGATPQLNDWEFATNFTSLIDSIDATILTEQTWEVYNKPTLSNYPASGWEANGTLDLHLGNMAYDMVTGKTYRFILDDSQLIGDNYKWIEIQDEEIKQAAALAIEAGKHASNFAYESTTHGLVFSTTPITSDSGVTSLATLHTRLKADGLWIYLGQNALAKYGLTTVFYKYGTSDIAATLNLNGLSVLAGEVAGIHVTNSDIHSNNHDAFNSTNAGFYLGSNGKFSMGSTFSVDENGNTLIGNESGSYIKFNNGTLSMNVSSLLLSGSSVATSNEVTNAAKTATNFLTYTSAGGLNIYESSSVTANKPHINILGDGLYIYLGNKKLVKYGDAIEFYKRTGHVDDQSFITWTYEVVASIDDNGLSFKKGNISLGEYFSVSSTGEIVAKKGTIGPMNIGYMNTGSGGSYLSCWIGQRDNYDERNLQGITMEANANFGVGIKDVTNSLRLTNFMVSDGGFIEMCTYLNNSNPYSQCTIYFLDKGTDAIRCLYKSSYSSNLITAFQLGYTGNVTIAGTLTQSSDERRKNVINSNLINYKELFMSINPISFTWKDNYDDMIHFGIGAQTLKNNIDTLGYSNLALVLNNNDSYYANYIELLMLSIPVVQEQEKRIEKLEAELEELRKKVK